VESESRDGPPRALLIAAIVVAVGAIVAVLVLAMLRQSSPEERPEAIVAAPAPKADSAECHALADALPDELGDFRRVPAAEPAPVGAAAWRASADGEPIILRCGVDRPVEFVVGTPLQVVDAVQWFQVADEERSTWFVVDRAVYVALTLPPGSGPTPIQEISQAVAKVLPAKEIDPAPVR
jgi:Protein of unknown function (DUF3515)